MLEVDPIQRRIVLAVTNIPEGQERPETPSKVIPMETDDYNLSDPIPVPAAFEEPGSVNRDSIQQLKARSEMSGLSFGSRGHSCLKFDC